MHHIEVAILHNGGGNSSLQDMAKGAGGAYRYLKQQDGRDAPVRITDVALFRSKKQQFLSVDPSNGWHESTFDINEGRGGDFLYVVWKFNDKEVRLVEKAWRLWARLTGTCRVSSRKNGRNMLSAPCKQRSASRSTCGLPTATFNRHSC